MTNSIEFDLSFKDESAQEALSVLKEVGAKDAVQVPKRGFTGVEIAIIGILGAQAFANLIIKLLPLWKCGVVVDARGSKVATRKDCSLPQGSVLVISKSGIQTNLERPSGFEMNSLIEKIISEAS